MNAFAHTSYLYTCPWNLSTKIKMVDNFFKRVYYHTHKGNGVFEVSTLEASLPFFLAVS